MTNAGSHNVSVINIATHAVEATVKVGRNPLDVAITTDSARAYVANADSNSVSVGVGFVPIHVSVSPDGASAYVTNAGSNSVSVIDTSTNTVTGTVPVGVFPVNAAIF